MNIKMYLLGYLVFKLFVEKLFNILKCFKSMFKWKVKIFYIFGVINLFLNYDVIVENLRCSYYF